MPTHIAAGAAGVLPLPRPTALYMVGGTPVEASVVLLDYTLRNPDFMLAYAQRCRPLLAGAAMSQPLTKYPVAQMEMLQLHTSLFTVLH